MALRKCWRSKKVRVAEACSLPSDLLLEIMARTDFRTIVRCGAVCKHLRRDILSPSFICRVTQQAAPCILALLCTYDEKPLTLVHPATPAAASFCDSQLSPFMLCNAGKDFLHSYYPLTSRGGLIVLRRLRIKMRPKSKRSSHLCVHDPMTGHRTFLPRPPVIRGDDCNSQNYVLLTPADGISCSFMLFVADFYKHSIKIQTATSSSQTWGPISTYASHPDDFPWWSVSTYGAPVVLQGSIIHWLAYHGDQILTYNMGTGTLGKVKLPLTNGNANPIHLATASHGNLLKLLAVEGFIISVWLQLPVTKPGGCGDWLLQNVIDIEEKLRLLCPHIPLEVGVDVVIKFEGSGKSSGDVVLLHVPKKGCDDVLVVLNLETKEMHAQEWGFLSLEIDLPFRLQNMKVFS